MFMYDNDKESSRISSKVIHIDIKSDDKTVSHGNVTVYQPLNSPAPEPQIVSPVIEPDDASHFSYHTFLYTSARDEVCMKVRPANETAVTSYAIYLKFKRAPTILHYDVIAYVNAETDWQVCILPNQMRGHTGLTFLGIQVPLEGSYYFITV